MNESTMWKLMVIVERAVRPVRASLPRKKKMREELLAHVTAVFEDELPRCRDEAAALLQVEMRFGDPNDLSRKLQESVPMSDRCALLIEHLIEPRMGESLFQRAVRYGMTIFAVDAILSLGLLLLIFPLIGKANAIGTAAQMLLVVAVAIGVMTFVATPLTIWLERTLFGASGRSLVKACLPVALSCFVPVLNPLVFFVAMFPFVSDNMILCPPVLWGMLPATLVAPLGLIGMAKLNSDEEQYRQEWAKLQIDPEKAV